MVKRLSVSAVALLFAANPARAANCPANPYTFTNGNNADATQVMADFNNLLGCANTNLAPQASPSFTGNVGIGTASPAEALDVYGPIVLGAFAERLSLNSGSIGFNRRTATGTIYNSSAFAYQIQHTGSTTAGSDFLAFQVYNPSGGTVTGAALSINGQGGVAVGATSNTSYTFFVNGPAAGTGAWINASDERLKTNITPISGALGQIEQLRGIRYNWKSAGERSLGKSLKFEPSEAQIGFLAQEVEKVVPEAVVKPAAGTEGIYGLKEGALIPLLVEAIKEQQAEIEELRALVAQITTPKQ